MVDGVGNPLNGFFQDPRTNNAFQRGLVANDLPGLGPSDSPAFQNGLVTYDLPGLTFQDSPAFINGLIATNLPARNLSNAIAAAQGRVSFNLPPKTVADTIANLPAGLNPYQNPFQGGKTVADTIAGLPAGLNPYQNQFQRPKTVQDTIANLPAGLNPYQNQFQRPKTVQDTIGLLSRFGLNPYQNQFQRPKTVQDTIASLPAGLNPYQNQYQRPKTVQDTIGLLSRFGLNPYQNQYQSGKTVQDTIASLPAGLNPYQNQYQRAKTVQDALAKLPSNLNPYTNFQEPLPHLFPKTITRENFDASFAPIWQQMASIMAPITSPFAGVDLSSISSGINFGPANSIRNGLPFFNQGAGVNQFTGQVGLLDAALAQEGAGNQNQNSSQTNSENTLTPDRSTFNEIFAFNEAANSALGNQVPNDPLQPMWQGIWNFMSNANANGRAATSGQDTTEMIFGPLFNFMGQLRSMATGERFNNGMFNQSRVTTSLMNNPSVLDLLSQQQNANLKHAIIQELITQTDGNIRNQLGVIGPDYANLSLMLDRLTDLEPEESRYLTVERALQLRESILNAKTHNH